MSEIKLGFFKLLFLVMLTFSLTACEQAKKENTEVELKPSFSETTVLSKNLSDTLQDIFDQANAKAQLDPDTSGPKMGFTIESTVVNNKAYYDDFAVIPIQTEQEYYEYLYSVLDSKTLDMMRFPHEREKIEGQVLSKVKSIDFDKEILIVLSHPNNLGDYTETVKLTEQADHLLLKVNIFGMEQSSDFTFASKRAWVNNFYFIKRGSISKIDMTINNDTKHEIVLYKNEPLHLELESTSETSAVE